MRLLQKFDTDIVTITEGHTKILVPKGATTCEVPPKEPAFFNPRARVSRDYSIIAYSAFVKNVKGPKVFLEGLSGLGARGVRVANEVKMDKVILNDLNPRALELATESAKQNGVSIETSEMETCRFFSKYSKKGERGTIVDVDPFGSPAKFLDCCVRATVHGGMLSVTATDLQVLNGLFPDTCVRRYGGASIRAEFGDEVALRLILGCLRGVTGRLDIKFEPLFAQSDQHYYRVFVRIYSRRDVQNSTGFLFYCKNCGERGAATEKTACKSCGSIMEFAGPLWIGPLHSKEFLHTMESESENLIVDKSCKKTITKAISEAGMPAAYYTVDEIASMAKTSPIRVDEAIRRLRQAGYTAGPTSLEPTGFKTDAKISEIKRILS